ncbi:MAG: 30S ribosomal protein S12 methylthiotransferase RimO [Pseudomonadota bacterium]
MTKLHFISLGCPKNLVDSEVMLGDLIAKGFVLTDDPAEAEAIIVNTCAFIEDAKKEAIDTILEMGVHKKSGRCRLLAVVGCLPQRYRDELAGLLPEVDLFVGAGEFPKIAEFMKSWNGEQAVHVARPSYIYDHETPRLHTTPRHVGYLKIAEGCFHPCSFCVIPRVRGKFRSRPVKSIVEEAQGMLGHGVRELNVIAQDVTAYGRDIGADIATLMEELARLPGPKWIRLLYAYPHGFPAGLVDVIRDNVGICKYIDIPIQHISGRILKSMRRGGGEREIRDLLRLIRREVPDISLRTSFIVGYPGETEEEFDELVDFVCEERFDHAGVFVFSPEEGTPAAALKKRVPPDVAEARRAELMDAQREVSLSNNMRFVGKRLNVLIEGPSAESPHLIQARHEGQAPDVDGVVYINEGKATAGEFAEVEITEAQEYDLIGKVV